MLTYVLLILLPSLVISGATRLFINRAYGKWSQVPNGRNINGVDAAQHIMQQYQLSVNLEGTPQQLGDHFSPKEGVVRLSPNVAQQPSVASIAIAAHEFGHVQQYAHNSPLIAVRSFILPIAQHGGGISTWLIMGGLIISVLEPLAIIGLLLFAATTLFSIFTLPVELDASRRAMKMMDDSGMFANSQDRKGARAVLTAAALTYVGAMVISILNLAYWAMLVFGGGSRRS